MRPDGREEGREGRGGVVARGMWSVYSTVAAFDLLVPPLGREEKGREGGREGGGRRRAAFAKALVDIVERRGRRGGGRRRRREELSYPSLLLL